MSARTGWYHGTRVYTGADCCSTDNSPQGAILHASDSWAFQIIPGLFSFRQELEFFACKLVLSVLHHHWPDFSRQILQNGVSVGDCDVKLFAHDAHWDHVVQQLCACVSVLRHAVVLFLRMPVRLRLGFVHLLVDQRLALLDPRQENITRICK